MPGFRQPSVTQLMENMLDITEPLLVEVVISPDRKTLWVNVDGVCALRVCRPQMAIRLSVEDKDNG